MQSPYDPEMHYSMKRQLEWSGYKVHITETCDDDAAHLVTHVSVLHGGGRGKGAPIPAVDQATRTEFGRQSSIRLRTWAAMATSVARASSLWKRSPSPMTCFQRANWPSTPAL